MTSYNKHTGTQIKKRSLINRSPVAFFATDAAGILYIVQDDTTIQYASTITAIDPKSGTAIFTETALTGHKFFTAGQTFGYYDGQEIILLAKNESKQNIPLHNTDRFFSPKIFTYKNSAQLLYIDSDDQELVAFDTDTRTEKWRFSLKEKLKSKPCMSQDGAQLFMFTSDAHIIALNNHGETVQPLWNIKTPITFTWGSAELALSPDGKTLFCLQVDYGDLYTFDTLTGNLLATTKCEEGRDRHLLGVSHDGLPYIQGKCY